MATSSAPLAVANTILAQLGGSGRLVQMIGAKHFVGSANALTFQFAGRGARNQSNCIRITLDPWDTYTVEFLSCRGVKVTPKGTFTDIYADGLRELIEHETGLYLSLGTLGRH
jgi:hypothetical protein